MAGAVLPRSLPLDAEPACRIDRAAPVDAAAWDAFVTSHPDRTGCHEWAWRDVIARVFGHACPYLVARDARSEAVVGVLPLVLMRSAVFGRSLTSMPYLNYGGVLATNTAVARALADEAASLARAEQCAHVELRHTARQLEELPFRQHKVSMRLALASDLWTGLDRKVRNQVRKAEKSGLGFVRGGAELLPEFYRVFARNMRDLGTPVYDRRWFAEVLRAFPARAHLLVVRLGDRPVAAGLTLRTGDMVEIPWASSVRDFNHLCPNHLLYWRALEVATAEGARTFDFGRSTPGEGTYKFKEQWGAQALPLYWEYCLLDGAGVPDHSPKNPKYRLAIAAWQRLPLWIANAIGPRIVKGIP
jgi:FemAB-related protein (PEP-CTERM system-associated)